MATGICFCTSLCAWSGLLHVGSNTAFTYYQTGTLGFVIEPLAANEDYDWQLFDVTGHQPKDVYTDASLIVIGNWAPRP
jgi:hypothetical protein